MMLWMVSLCRTLEMMQDDVRTSGIDVFLVYNWFSVHEELFMDVLDENNEFGIRFVVLGCGRVQAECFLVLGCRFACVCRQQQPA